MRAQLIALCLLAFGVTCMATADWAGVGARPWFGWWDANYTVSGPYTIALLKLREGGAAANAGLRDGDRIDLRAQPLSTRLATVHQLLGDRETIVSAQRGASHFAARVFGTSVWEGPVQWKLPALISMTLASLCFIACALLLSLRSVRSDSRTLALVLLCITAQQLDPTFIVVPWPTVQLALFVVSRTCLAIASLLLLRLASQAGVPSTFRTWVGFAAIGAVVLNLISNIVAVLGIATLWIDPLPFLSGGSALPGWNDAVVYGLVVTAGVSGVVSTPEHERPRTAWLLLPLPVALLASAIAVAISVSLTSWFANMAAVGIAYTFWLLGACSVTYAVLNRRVFDLEFVIGRAVVVGTVSAIVVASFALLEFLLNTVLAGVSHATGLVANAALALVLGLSMNPIHRRVDATVERLLFHKRLEDERALLEFSKEAAFVTSADALLDRALETLQRHTDARNASILLDGSGAFITARSFGFESALHDIDENDPTILALKAHHAPLDPHRYESRVRGALALPMLAKGRLLGVTVLGERAGGEAYAPDEVAALSQLAQGVGSALDALAITASTSREALAEIVRSQIAPLREALDAIARVLQARE